MSPVCIQPKKTTAPIAWTPICGVYSVSWIPRWVLYKALGNGVIKRTKTLSAETLSESMDQIKDDFRAVLWIFSTRCAVAYIVTGCLTFIFHQKYFYDKMDLRLFYFRVTIEDPAKLFLQKLQKCLIEPQRRFWNKHLLSSTKSNFIWNCLWFYKTKNVFKW